MSTQCTKQSLLLALPRAHAVPVPLIDPVSDILYLAAVADNTDASSQPKQASEEWATDANA